MRQFIPRFLWATALLAALLAVGTAGYMLIDGRGPAESLYMTLTTVTAVGFGEVWPLSDAGRTFTMFLLLVGITWLGFWFAILTALIVELDLQGALRRRRTMSAIAKMQGHVIICGVGRTGRQVAQELQGTGIDLVIIENDPARIQQFAEILPDAHVIMGDATHDQTLLDAGLLKALGLVTCLSHDTDNLFVCLSARDLAAKVKIVARAYEEETMDKLYRAGADHVVSPTVSSAIRMASVLLRPSAVTFLDIATRSSELSLRVEQAVVGATSDVAGRTLAEARIPQRTGLIVIAVRKRGDPGSPFVFNPVADTRVETGDEMIVLGKDDQIQRLLELVG